MLSWFFQQSGIDNAFVERRDQVTFAFQEVRYLWFGLPIVLALGVGIFVLQRRNLRSAPLSLIAALTLCRVFILALLVTVLAGPYVKLEEVVEKKPIVAVMFDDSQSMGLEAGPFPDDGEEVRRLAVAAGYKVNDSALSPELRKEFNAKTRAKMAQTVAQAQKTALFDPLFKKYEVRFYSFAREATPFGVDPASLALPEPLPEGPVTQIGDSVAQVVALTEGRPIAGILVFSDGENTGGMTLEEAARECKQRNAPVFTIPVGTTRNLKDVSIVDVSSSGQVTVGDTARVSIVLESRGYDGKPAKVELFDGKKLLDTKEIILRGAEQQQVEMTFTANDPGPRILTAYVKPFDDESQKENNRDMTLLRVSEEKIKVLYIEGPPRWDFRFLKNAMRRDKGLAGRIGAQPDIILENEWRRLAETDRPKALPRTLDELAAYHTIILGDVSPKLLSPEFLKLISRAVREKGVGLLIEAGPQSMPHEFDGALLDLLPVQIDKRSTGIFAPTAKPFKLELTPDGSLNEVMRLYDEPGRNQSAWSQMLPYQWCVNAVRPTPTATVLMSNPNIQNSYGKLPLITHHVAEKGRVMLVGTDSTWLWRQNVADRFFYKFWGQAIRFVARKDESKRKKSSIEISPIPPRPKETVHIQLFAFTESGAPIQEKTLRVDVAGPGFRKSVELKADPDNKGRFFNADTDKVPFQFPMVGDYRISFGTGANATEANFSVKRSSEELRFPNVNRGKMKLLADATNGKMAEMTDPDFAKTILERIEQSQLQTMTEKKPRTASIWDNWMLLTLLVVVYSIDIGLRRLAGLS
jgi:hypothetical protein